MQACSWKTTAESAMWLSSQHADNFQEMHLCTTADMRDTRLRSHIWLHFWVFRTFFKLFWALYGCIWPWTLGITWFFFTIGIRSFNCSVKEFPPWWQRMIEPNLTWGPVRGAVCRQSFPVPADVPRYTYMLILIMNVQPKAHVYY